MSDKKKDTVFAEGSPVMTTTSPYEKYSDAQFEYITNLEESDTVNDKVMRLECLNSALKSGAKDPDRIIHLAKLFWGFVETGE